MSNSSLMPIVAMLPEPCLERAITSCLYSLSVAGELELADKIIGALLIKVNAGEALRAEAAALGVQIAIKSRNIPLAVSRFEEISRLGDSVAILNFKSDALFSLAASLLPDNPSNLAKLWEGCLSPALPVHAQQILAQIGRMLLRQFRRNRDKRNAKRIWLDMRKKFEISALGKRLPALKKSIGL